MATSHLYHKEDVATGYSKMEKLTGKRSDYTHPTDKAESRYGNKQYYENTNLDPLTLPTREKVEP